MPCVADRAVQAVAAQQQDVAVFERQFLHLHVEFRVGAEGPGQHVPHLVAVDGLLRGPGPEHRGGPRIVAGDLLQQAPAPHVQAAVADSGEERPPAADDHGDERRTHAGQLRGAARLEQDPPVGHVDGVLELDGRERHPGLESPTAR